MKRRTFFKSAAAAGAAAMLPSSILSLASGCTPENKPGWNFDEVLDRTGTWSIKYRRAEGGKLAMWIADMDFKTDPVKRRRFHETLDNAKLREASISTLVATVAAYTHEPVWLEAVKRYIEGNIDCVEDFFSRHACGIRPVRPEASFLIWLDCRALGLPQAELMDLFNEKAGVVMNNGAGYGTGGEGFVRLNVGCPRSVVEEALRRIEAALQE